MCELFLHVAFFQDVEQADQSQRGGAGGETETLVGQVSGEVGGDEGDVEAADEEAGVEQPVGAVACRFPERFLQGLARPFPGRRGGPAGDAERKHSTERDQPRKDDQRDVIADVAKQPRREGDDQELAERAARIYAEAEDIENAAHGTVRPPRRLIRLLKIWLGAVALRREMRSGAYV